MYVVVVCILKYEFLSSQTSCGDIWIVFFQTIVVIRYWWHKVRKYSKVMLAYCCMYQSIRFAQGLHWHPSVLLWCLWHLFFFHLEVNLSDLWAGFCITSSTSAATCVTSDYLCDNLRPIEPHISNWINYVLVKVIITHKENFLFLLYWVLCVSLYCIASLIFLFKFFNHDIRWVVIVNLHLRPYLSLCALIVLRGWRLGRGTTRLLWLVISAHYYVVYDVEIVIDETSCTVEGCACRRGTKHLRRAYLVISIWRLLLLGRLRLLLLVILRNCLWVSRLVECWIFTRWCSYIIIIIEWIKPHSIILSIIVLLLHITKEVVLEEVIVIWILNCPSTTHSEVCSWSIIIRLISFLIQFLNYILMLNPIVREVIIICRIYMVCLLGTSSGSNCACPRYLDLLLAILFSLLSI